MKKTVLYIGNFSFPLGNAAGKRVYANGKLLKELDYDVIFIGMSKDITDSESLMSTKRAYEGFYYYNFPYPKKLIDWVNYNNIFIDLANFLTDTKIIDDLALVIYYGSPSLSFFNTKLIKYCRKNNIKVVADCVDWLTTKTNNFLFDVVKTLDNRYQKAYANKKADGVIAISSYLAKYYRKFGCNIVIIPPLSPVDYKIQKEPLENRPYKTIIYAGLPFRRGKKVTDCNTLKDRIDKTIILLCSAKKEGCKFIFNIYGFTKEEYLIAIPTQKIYIDELGDSIIFHGLLSNQEVVKNIIASDFTILIRDVNRSTTAGFPTKISESISCGTPVITTNTSDLQDYIKEGKNGFFIETNKICRDLDYVKKILNLDTQKVRYMKNYCIRNKVFYYKEYVTKMNHFLGSLFNYDIKKE